ncbi:hypothetical protein SAMN03080615_02638 [Amphritea atlantica]|uniref:DUF4145 domain-containing protein n=1 Tax=Amphritea atlantica TaxID=355243 RepID=A0A1H9ILP0_9GAMM|nr:hypothetical protein [Amphritea atlantica]SEQ75533.1 hypothetical protein SAMN03080615_02638 [Amphritea atlantica]
MKTTVFQLVNPTFEKELEVFGPQETVFRIPTLPAYSIIDYSLDGDYSPYESGNYRAVFSLEGDSIRIQGVQNKLFRSGKDRFVIHYAGIRDYSLLFPHINESSCRVRLGQYAEEADMSFESGAWLSFMMMAGAVIEGLLDNCTPASADSFNKMIIKARQLEILSEEDETLCHKVKEARNLIHASKHPKEYVTRALAMDTYVFYDALIKRHWDH